MRRVFAIALALILIGCAGTGGAPTFGRQPGIYLIDQGNSRLIWMSDFSETFFQKFDPPLTQVNNLVNGTVDHNGKIYLIDGNLSSIVRFDDLAADNRTVIGSHGTGVGQFMNPVRVTVDSSDRIYVIDRDQNLLIRFPANLSTWTTLDLTPWFAGSDEPDLTTDSAGHIFLAGASHIVRLTGMTAVGVLTYGTSGSAQGNFNALTGIALDDAGHIFVADSGNNRIVRIDDMTGLNWAPLGSTGNGVNQFNIPFGIGVDHSGVIYVGDRNNHRLIEMSDMTGAGWTELTGVPASLFSFPLSVYPHLPAF